MRILKNGSPDERQEAAAVLVEAGKRDRGIVQPLIGLLDYRDVHTRWWAADSLGRLRTRATEATPKLLERLADDQENDRVRARAAVALELVGVGPQAVVPLLERLLDAQSTELRHAALGVLSSYGARGKKAVPPLVDLLDSDRLGDKLFAAQALRRIGAAARPAVSALVQLLEDENTYVRRCSAKALGGIGEAAAEAVPALVDLMKSGEAEERYEVMVALGEMGSAARNAVPALVEALGAREKQAAAAQALVKMGPAALPGVEKALASEDPRMVRAALYVLIQWGPRAKAAEDTVRGLLDHADADVAQSARLALRRMREQSDD